MRWSVIRDVIPGKGEVASRIGLNDAAQGNLGRYRTVTFSKTGGLGIQKVDAKGWPL
ncbi:MAG: hypothetical protein H6558_03075 [Lewinellaceae bacterium]|nr:hypothetical protein [Lewinellaceae bacterium]